MNLRLGIILHHVNNSTHGDNSESLYYGSVIKDPDLGIRYTFVKSPNGDITLLRTESTDKVVETVHQLIEVATESSWEANPKMTFLVKWDDVDYVHTFNDRNIEQFKIMVDDKFEDLKPYITNIIYEHNKEIDMPFIQDNAIAVTFEFTKGRSIKYLSKLIPELFRRIFDEHLLIDDKIKELMDDKFLLLDKLKANDSRQDNEVIKSAESDAFSHAVRKNIEEWIDKNNDIFMRKFVVKYIDLSQYNPNQKCYIILRSKDTYDLPVITSQVITNDGKDSIFINHIPEGYVIKEKIVVRTGNTLSASEDFLDHTFIAYGGAKLKIITSSTNLSIDVLRASTSVNNRSKDIIDGSEIVSNLTVNNELLMIRESDKSALYPVVTGTPPKMGPVAYVYDWIWRAATKSGWGAGWGGNNTQALREDRDIGDFCNTRKTFTLMDGITVRELIETYETLTVYIDLYCAVASGGGAGGIQWTFDATNGRMSYQGYGTMGNNLASIPNNKLRVPKKMMDLKDTAGCFAKATINAKDLKMDGTWLKVYSMPTSTFGSTIGQVRRKNRLLGMISWTYYLRVRSENELEMLVSYYQQADGDKHDNCFTQAAGRDSYFIYGDKRNTLKVDMKDKYTGNTLASYPATEYKQFSPSLLIEDIENNYSAYLPLEENPSNKVNTFKVDDITTGKSYYAVPAKIQGRSAFHTMFARINNKNNVYTKQITIAELPESASLYNMAIDLDLALSISENRKRRLSNIDHPDIMKYNENIEPVFNLNKKKRMVQTVDGNYIELKDRYSEYMAKDKPVYEYDKLNLDTNMSKLDATGRDIFMTQTDKGITYKIPYNSEYIEKKHKVEDKVLIKLNKLTETLDDFNIILDIGESETVIKRKLMKTYNKLTHTIRIDVLYYIPPYLNKEDYIIDIDIHPSYELVKGGI